MVMTNSPPNDVRNFVHKRLFSAAKGLLTGGPAAAVGGFISGGRRAPRAAVERFEGRLGAGGFRGLSRAAVRRPTARTLTARPDATSAAQKRRGLDIKFPDGISSAFGGDAECPIPFQVWDEVKGKCVWGIGDQPGRDDTPIGNVVMGRYGAGEVPGNHVINRAVCRRGMVVGNDGICYNKSQIKNSERQWPRGRRPLLTGGDMRAISTAARAGRRLEGATKRLQKIGLMKKPARGVSRRQIAAEIRTEMHQRK